MLFNTFFQQELDGEYKTKLDFAKLTSPKVAELIAMEVLLIDEFSMLDKKCFEGISEILSIIDHSRRPGVASPDPFGSVHLLLFGGKRSFASTAGRYHGLEQKTNTRFQTVATRIFGGTVYRSALRPRDL